MALLIKPDKPWEDPYRLHEWGEHKGKHTRPRGRTSTFGYDPIARRERYLKESAKRVRPLMESEDRILSDAHILKIKKMFLTGKYTRKQINAFWPHVSYSMICKIISGEMFGYVK
jgi:hypothetical protein